MIILQDNQITVAPFKTFLSRERIPAPVFRRRSSHFLITESPVPFCCCHKQYLKQGWHLNIS